jgi:predicted acetyltransferase
LLSAFFFFYTIAVTLLHPAFSFVDHGPLVDRELELVPAQHRWIDDLLTACRHPRTVAEMPIDARLTRDDVEKFLAESPWGRFPGDPVTGRVPGYQFWMLLRHGAGGPHESPPLRIAGGLSLRIGMTPSIELYYGHLGYHVYPAARGHRYAYRACQLVMPILRAHGIRPIYLTCNPENAASWRTIEQLGGRYLDTVAVPYGEPLYSRGEFQKARFVL